jgi:signal transduction histidine kinase
MRTVPATPSTTVDLAFSVDTHVFRELGKLLVGRDSTALVELVKNAYDADATHVVLHAEGLDAPNGFITVTDDGTGMSFDDFVQRFLRIAGRSKEGRGRRTRLYGRRYTGAKGIGRLSAYKLAAELTVESVPASRALGVRAVVDWESLENATGDVHDTKLVEAQPLPSGAGDAGTSMTLRRLRAGMGQGRRQRFLREVRATRPDAVLFTSAPQELLGIDLLVPEIAIADAQGPTFAIELSGELDPGDQPWPSLLAAVDWVVEIDARDEVVHYRISPSQHRQGKQAGAEPRTFTYQRDPHGPRFVARILARTGRQSGVRLPDLVESFGKEVSGIRVYMEGFRVVPYGSPGNDWLEIDRDAVRRNALQYSDPSLPETSDTDVRIYQLSSQNYIGGVFLHEATAQGLEMVVNREGFMPSPAFDEVTEIVRRGIDLSVRVRASLGATEREEKARLKQQQRQELLDRLSRQHEPVDDRRPSPLADRAPIASPAEQLSSLVEAASDAVSGLRARTGGTDSATAAEIVKAALDEARSTVYEMRDEQAQLRVLASVGTQFGAFIHEVNALLAQARIILALLDELADDEDLPARSRTRVRRVRRAMRELVASLERQAIYLTDTIGAEARRRRSRQKIADRLTTAVRLLGPAAGRRAVTITDQVPADVRTLPMFPAELNVVLTNLLSNAIKAAAPGGRVHVTAAREPGRVSIRVDNTGVGVDPDAGERWFRPFETTTSEIDDILGQGMGLGLPLTRRIVEEYGGDVRFVAPLKSYATGVEVLLPTGPT